MRLKSLWVDGFKNLNDFKIDFEKRDGITVLIGNNASGKSNILEAISAIFAGIYNEKLKPNFEYELIYQINSDNIRISSDKKSHFLKFSNDVKITDIKIKDVREVIGHRVASHNRSEYLPSQVIALYSGEELRLWEGYYQYFYNKFQRSIKLSNVVIPAEQKMFYVDSDYWNIALLTLAYSKLENLQNFVADNLKINIENIAFNFNNELLNDKFKLNTSSLLTMKLFVEIIKIKGEFDTSLMPDDEWIKKVENLGGFTTEEDIKIANRIIKKLKSRENYIEELQKYYFSLPHTALIELDAGIEKEFFQNILIATNGKNKKYEYIHNIDIYFNGGQTVADLSEGQKKQILLKLALEVLADENSLLLFDEPDAHIHISNKKLIPEMLKDYDNREIILTTHSPTLAHSFDDKHIAMLGKNDKGNPEIIAHDKQTIISQLTNNLWNYHEQGLFFNSKNLVLLVEGNSDKKHIETALDKLKDSYSDLDFDVFSMNGADNIESFILGIKKSKIFDKNKQYIAVFDYDKKGKKCHKAVEGQTRNNDAFSSLLLPLDDNLEIENMYPVNRQKESYQNAINDMGDNFNSKNIETDAKKYLANNCQSFELQDFDKFKKLFDLIIEIKAGDNQ